MNSENLATANIFFTELKKFNGTNFKTLRCADIDNLDSKELKCFSSILTRYFLFCEKHPEITTTATRMLYYQLKLDMVARFFSKYPVGDNNELRPFHSELTDYCTQVGMED